MVKQALRQTKRLIPKYTLEFKKNAARLVNEKGYTHQQAADHLDISINVIGRWSKAERSPVRSSSEENNFKLDGSS